MRWYEYDICDIKYFNTYGNIHYGVTDIVVAMLKKLKSQYLKNETLHFIQDNTLGYKRSLA